MAKISNKALLKVTVAIILIAVCIILAVAERNVIKPDTGGEDFVRVFDVGQAESILIYSNGYSALIDTGINTYSNELCIELEKLGIEGIDVLLISHLHADHTGGIEGLFEHFKVKNLILPELSVESEGLSQAQLAINEVTSSKGEIYNAVQGMNFKIGEFEITILASYGEMDDENNRSVITSAEINGLRFLFTGDAERKVENQLLNEGLDLKSDVLKLGHHGSNTSTSEAFLKAVRPKYAAISVGEGNMYGHPHNEVLADLEYYGTEIYRTDQNGDITFNIIDGRIKIETER